MRVPIGHGNFKDGKSFDISKRDIVKVHTGANPKGPDAVPTSLRERYLGRIPVPRGS